MWTESRRSMRRRFSLLPPARALAPSLSVSSSRAEGSAIGSLLNATPRSSRAIQLGSIERRQQDKPLWGPPVVVRVPEGVAEVAPGHELAVDQGAERCRILTVLDPVDFQSAFEAEDLVAGEQMEGRSAAGRRFPWARAEGGRNQ